MSKRYYEEEYEEEVQEEETTPLAPLCPYCIDKKTKKEIPIWYMDKANNLRISAYCPACGRKYEAVDY